ncbi:NAD(P)/FAD-dependent oxidoreductase [Nocardioides sp. SYSU DS0663]|uniref:NAD(P)/FAD-dependent oxidoreductase n=1 Tax=Nocardioides sp. SYSU DS0663 TaxID=3416445 RepID=UPI003F4C4E83
MSSNAGSSSAVVVGAGVIGLTTAVLMAERGYDVRVVAAQAPLQTTSVVASAMVGPNLFPEATPPFEWERRGREAFTRLAEETGSGVTLRRGALVARQPPPFPMTLDGRPIDTVDDGSLPEGFGWGFRTVTPVVDMRAYLRFLLARLDAAGGRVEIRRLSSLTEAAREAPVVMNCSGLGARELAGVAVRPVRGQHVVVANPGIEEFFMESPFGPSWISFWPHGDRVVLGSTAARDDSDTAPREQEVHEIVARCAQVDPRFADASVLEVQVGLRPEREEGVHLAVQEVAGSTCVHNVGHGGSGVSQSWGTVEAALELLDDALASR